MKESFHTEGGSQGDEKFSLSDHLSPWETESSQMPSSGGFSIHPHVCHVVM